MKALRTLLLGSAGAAMLFAAGTVAQAADAPEAAKGRDPVWRCDTAGFIEYPGSDLCFKIGGKVAAWMSGAEDQVDAGDGEFDQRKINLDTTHSTGDSFGMGALARFNIDVRNATEFGVVRAFMEFEASDANGNTGGSPGLRHAFVQIGNWLMGKTWSIFRSGMTPEIFTDPISLQGDGPTIRVVQLRYTFKMGNGVTVMVALEDPARWDGPYTGGTMTGSRNEIPAAVAVLQVAGTWGKAQAGVHVQQHSWRSSGIAGNDSDRKVGWAALLSVALDVPGTLGDVIYLQGTYSDGNSGVVEAFGVASWGLNAAGTATDSVTTLTAAGGYEHYWTKTLRSTIGATYVDIDYNTVSVATTSVDKGVAVWGNLVWTVVKGLDLGVEVVWARREFLNGTKGDAVGAAAEVVRAF